MEVLEVSWFLGVYIGVKAEEFFSLDNASLRALAHLSWYCWYQNNQLLLPPSRLAWLERHHELVTIYFYFYFSFSPLYGTATCDMRYCTVCCASRKLGMCIVISREISCTCASFYTHQDSTSKCLLHTMSSFALVFMSLAWLLYDVIQALYCESNKCWSWM